MICPRCGNEWDATKGACTRCGFVIPTAAQKTSAGIEQNRQQTGMSGTDSLFLKTRAQHGALPLLANRSIDSQQQELGRSQKQSQTPLQPQSSTHQFPSDPLTGYTLNQERTRPTASVHQGDTTTASLKTRPLLPGVLLRGGRYRLQELQERQDWLLGTFEAVWIGKDFARAGSQVMICEVVLPENRSIIAQTILRTATMALASVGRYPHIPALWDAFSDQGRSFFVFEPIEGESLIARIRSSGQAVPEQEVIECCLQMTDVLELLARQSPQLVHGLIRPEHIILSRNGPQCILTNFSIVLAGGGTQYITGMERSRLSPYTAPEFVRGVVDVRTDMYSLIATAYYAVTGSVPTNIGGNIPQAQRVNPNVSSAFGAILMKGLQEIPGKRYQHPAELRQEFLAMRPVNGAPGNSSNALLENTFPSPVSRNRQRADLTTERTPQKVAQGSPIVLNPTQKEEEPVRLLPRPEDLPPMKEANDTLNAAIWLCAILMSLIALVVLSQIAL